MKTFMQLLYFIVNIFVKACKRRINFKSSFFISFIHLKKLVQTFKTRLDSRENF